MTSLIASSAPASRFRSRLAVTRDLLVIGLCLTLLAGLLIDTGAGARPVQPAVQGTALIT